jgi:hypothetical protein
MSLDQLQGDTRQLFPVGGDGDLATTQNAPVFLGGIRGELIRRGGPKIIDRLPPGFGTRPLPDFGISPMPVRPPIFGIQPPMLQPAMPDYSSQFEKIGEQLGGFGKQLDALGSFNEQVGGIGKQFEAVNNKLDSLEKGLGSLGNQIASFENMQKAQPQEVRQPSYSPFGFGGLANLFMNMRRF